jgi:IclR family KDG regulon transcriptional repressor
VDEYLKRTSLIPHTPHTLVDRSKLLDELGRIRKQDYSVDNEEMEQGVRCVASLVVDHRAKPVAAVSISGAAMRITSGKIRSFAKSVKACSRAISKEMGFTGAD